MILAGVFAAVWLVITLSGTVDMDRELDLWGLELGTISAFVTGLVIAFRKTDP